MDTKLQFDISLHTIKQRDRQIPTKLRTKYSRIVKGDQDIGTALVSATFRNNVLLRVFMLHA